MNKKEVSEIKKQFKQENDHMVVNKIATYYVHKNEADEGQVRIMADYETSDAVQKYIPSTEADYYFDICKKTLSGQLGKSLIEYPVPLEELQDEGKCKKLSDLLQSNLNNKDLLTEYVKSFAENYTFAGDYVLCITHCTYDVPQKKKSRDEVEDEAADTENIVYNFMVVSICPMEYSDFGLAYKKDAQILQHDVCDYKFVRPPVSGFLFPVFNNRTADVNSVLCFFKNKKEPDTCLVENILGCKMALSSEDEKNKFNDLLTKVAAEKSLSNNLAVDYSITQEIHSQISDLIAKTSANTEITELDCEQIKDILRDSGISDDKLADFDEEYAHIIGQDVKLKAVNVINATKMDIKSPDVVINVKSNKSDRVVAQTVNGKKCLVIALDEDVEINGLNVKVK